MRISNLLALAALLAPVAASAESWGGAWGYATSPATKAVRGDLPAGTYRFRIRLSQSGDGMRLSFTNPEGAGALRIARATIAPAGEGFAIAGSEHPLTFAGATGATITGGGVLTSDAIDFAGVSGSDVIVSVATSGASTTVAGNAGFPVAFASAGTDSFAPQKLRPFLTLVAVRNPPVTCTIVAFGDSITEGARGTNGYGWPGALAQHLIAANPKRHCGVVNAGISGNRLLRDGRGTAGVDRFERDVASVPGAAALVLLEGINDIWHSTQPGEPPVSAEDIIAGYRTMIARAHARGMRVYGMTLTPSDGSKLLSVPALEAVRQQVNRWIRTGGAFDAVIDMERITRDGSTPPRLRSEYDSGDHLHPGDNGYAAMGKAVPLNLFPPHS